MNVFEWLYDVGASDPNIPIVRGPRRTLLIAKQNEFVSRRDKLWWDAWEKIQAYKDKIYAECDVEEARLVKEYEEDLRANNLSFASDPRL
jgi:hypothetical protein